MFQSGRVRSRLSRVRAELRKLMGFFEEAERPPDTSESGHQTDPGAAARKRTPPFNRVRTILCLVGDESRQIVLNGFSNNCRGRQRQ